MPSLLVFKLLGFRRHEEAAVIHAAANGTGSFRKFVNSMVFHTSWAQFRPVARPQLIEGDANLFVDKALWTWKAGATLLERIRSEHYAALFIPMCVQCCTVTGSWCDECGRAYCTHCEADDPTCCICLGIHTELKAFRPPGAPPWEQSAFADPSIFVHLGATEHEVAGIVGAACSANPELQATVAHVYQRTPAALLRPVDSPNNIECTADLYLDPELWTWRAACQILAAYRAPGFDGNFRSAICSFCACITAHNCAGCLHTGCIRCLEQAPSCPLCRQ